MNPKLKFVNFIMTHSLQTFFSTSDFNFFFHRRVSEVKNSVSVITLRISETLRFGLLN